MNRIARFDKVSFEQFSKDFENCIKDKDINISAKEAYDMIKLPLRATKGSAGYDFFAPFDMKLKPGETLRVPTGIRCSIEENWMLSLYPRSGLGFKYRLQLDNTVGIIDSDYYYSDNEGHIQIKISNCSFEGKSLEVLQGQGFAQGIFTQYGITVDDEADGLRNGGFGSTTK